MLHITNVQCFLDCECLHATIKDAVWCITFLHIKPNNMILIKCALGFCDESQEYNIPNEELYDRPMTQKSFGIYTYICRCVTHGIIPIVVILCRSCEKRDDIKNGLIKNTTNEKKKHFTKISCCIGEFYKIHYQ